MKLLQEIMAGFSRLPNEEPEEDLNLTGELDGELDGVADEVNADPDRQGMIRTVKGAHLVYKRQSESGTYDELWVYNTTDMRTEMETKRAILSGTDIPTTQTQSPDGEQSYQIWSTGNVQMLQIVGLPS